MGGGGSRKGSKHRYPLYFRSLSGFNFASAQVMADTNVFLDRLLNYDKENMKESTVEKMQPYIKDKNFRPEQVKQVQCDSCTVLQPN